MTPINVGNVDAILRIAFSAIYVGVGLTLLLAHPYPFVAVLFTVGVAGCALLIRSAITRKCPVHDAVGVDTTSRKPPGD